MWQKYKFEDNRIYYGRLGQCHFWIEKQEKLWQVATRYEDAPEEKPLPLKPVQSLDEGVNWTYYIADKHNNLHVVPSTPDRPLVVKPVNKFSILPGMSLDLYLSIPLWVQLYAANVKPDNMLVEFPETDLSSTWFGDPDNGELAYSYPGAIAFSLKEMDLHVGEGICQVHVRNESEASLDFQRLAVPVEQLSIYSNGEVLCTNEVQVRYKGEDKSTEIHIAGGSPSYIDGLKMLNAARISTSKNILKKSFSFIKSIADY